MAHPADLIGTAFLSRPGGGDLPDISGAEPGVCCITGEFGPSLERKRVLGSSFTDLTGMMARESDRIGVLSTIALRYTIPVEGKKRPRWPEMMDSWWCDGEVFRVLDRPAARDLILNGCYTRRTWAGYINLTRKKHGMMRAVPNHGTFGRWAFAETVVDCRDIARVRRWYDRMNRAIKDGIGRQSIETADMPPGIIKKIGMMTWAEFQSWALPRRLNPLWGLCVYLLPTMAERAEAG